jgi:hypothetical protein
MRHLKILAALSLVCSLLISCEKENEESTLSGSLLTHSSCKSDIRSAFQEDTVADTLTCVDYTFDAAKHQLILKHINAGFNCCFDSIYCSVNLSKDTIRIQEHEVSAACDCECLYDLVVDIEGVESQKYWVKYIEPYRNGQQELLFEIDLSKEKEGYISIVRKDYPWAISTAL